MLNVSLRAHRFHHFWITFRVFLSGESEAETIGKMLWWMSETNEKEFVYCGTQNLIRLCAPAGFVVKTMKKILHTAVLKIRYDFVYHTLRHFRNELFVKSMSLRLV